MTGFDRLYARYATTHAGQQDSVGEARVVRRDVVPHLACLDARTARVLDLGCGQGGLVAALQALGFRDTYGIDISAEQVELAQQAGIPNVTEGDYREVLASQRWAAVVATDFLEHLDKQEVLEVFDSVLQSLEPGGVFIFRSPNGVSPFVGNYQYSDFTHLTILTPRSFSQIALSAGYSSVACYACPPIAHGVKSAVRRVAWRSVAAALRAALTAETGETGHIVTQNFVGVATSPG